MTTSCSRPHLVAAACALAAGTLSSSSAWAYCRTVTAQIPAGYDPASQGCFGAQGGQGVFDVYWKNLCVGYSLQQDASPLRGITLAQAQSIAAEAFVQWSEIACPGGGHPSIQAVDEGAVSCGMVQYESNAPNQHVIVFRDEGWPYTDSSNTLGLTTVTYDVTDGEIFDADMELNSHDYDLVATTPAPSGAYDLASVITHEAGHFLGLAHSTDLTAVMYAHYRAGASTPAPDDIAGICTMYLPDGSTRVTSSGSLGGDTCDATPRHGFTTLCNGQGGTGSGGSSSGGGGTPAHHGKCSVGGTPGGGRWAYVPAGLIGLALLARRLRRSARRGRALVVAAGVALTAASGITFAAREAQASVSIAVLFEELVRASTAVADVTPVEQQALWEGGRIVTYTRVRVDGTVAGDLPRETWIRTLGGVVGKVGQIVEGEPSFAIGARSLVFLRQRPGGFEVTARAQGQFPIAAVEGKEPRLASFKGAGALLPPSVELVARAAQLDPAGSARFARDVLDGRSLQDASREITSAWSRAHAK